MDRNDHIGELINMTQLKENTFHFTVSELIDELRKMPADMPVVTTGYDSGYENFYQPEIHKLKHEPDNLYPYGEFQLADADDKDTFDAVILERVVRYD